MQRTATRNETAGQRSGFTLVEVLTVIIIIGILAALLIPAVQIAVRRAKLAAMRAEVNGLSQAVDAYQAKYGDYPPDFSDWDLVRRHYLRIFPNINQEELQLLLSLCTDNGSVNPLSFNPTRIDRAEALVWSLGGFSSDPERPFTGTGGPLTFFTSVSRPLNFNANPLPREYVMYNSSRDNSLYDFQVERLGLFLDSSRPLDFDNRVMSTDDTEQYPAYLFGDWFPTFRQSESSLPVVYFDSRTYANLTPLGFNGYVDTDPSGSPVPGSVVRPYYSTKANPKSGNSPYGSIAAALNGWEFANPRSFQIISPGIDGSFGTLADISVNSQTYPLYFQVGTGYGIAPIVNATIPNELILIPNNPLNQSEQHNINGFIESSIDPSIVDNFQRDNVTNFISGALEDDVE